MEYIESNKAAASVTIGPKGQIVIPKKIRDMFGFQIGDTLFIIADENKGVAIISEKQFFDTIAPQIQKGDK